MGIDPDRLKNIYQAEGLSKWYFDGLTPVDLYREQKKGGFTGLENILHPELEGWPTKDGGFREPDVEIFEGPNNISFVRGCMGVPAKVEHYRGVSVGTQPRRIALRSSWLAFKIPEGTEIPQPLAITRDHEKPGRDGIHYTVAPKYDMPLGTFLEWLQVLSRNAEEIDAKAELESLGVAI